MKYKFISRMNNYGYLEIEEEINNQEEYREFVKKCKYACEDFSDEAFNESFDKRHNKEQIIEKPVNLASEGQKKYMAKLGIKFNETTTVSDAINLINEYKIAHNIPVDNRK